MEHKERSRRLILLTNDDGIRAEGLLALERVMRDYGQVITVAPERDTSGAGHSLTLHRPLPVRRLAKDSYAIDGTPTDCVTIALEKLLARKPDLLIAGINPGENIGDDIMYSGTVAAAVEGTMMGIPSFAVSMAGEAPYDFDGAAVLAAQIAGAILTHGLPDDTLLNVNIPFRPGRTAICLTHQGRRTYTGAVQETKDPWGRTHYWIGGGVPSMDPRQESDAQALWAGNISITPLHLDLTNYQAVKVLQRWLPQSVQQG